MSEEQKIPEVVNGPSMSEVMNSAEAKELMEKLQILTDLQTKASKKQGSKKPIEKKKAENRKKEKARKQARKKNRK